MRSTTKLTLGLIGGSLIAITAPPAANAHVSVTPDEIGAGGYGVLTFAFSHGCESSPTTSLKVTLPDGLASVAPTIDSDWAIDVERGDDGLVRTVTYTAATPVPIDLRGAVSMSIRLDADAPDTLAFPVVQTCVEGSTEWNQLAKSGEDPHSLDNPAPVVTVTDAAKTSNEITPVNVATTVVAGGGLAAALVALAIAVLAYRRRG